jgi:CHAT domain-containing protein/tetratricopeptide (TPR) repeat protein
MLCPQERPSGLDTGSASADPTQTRQGLVEMRGSQGSQEASLRKAEELVQEALALAQKQTSGDFRAATTHFQESARQFKLAGLPERAAKMYLEIGGIYFILSKYPQAREAYLTGLQLTHADELRCRILARMARTYSIIGWNLEAMRYSGEALSLCEKLPDSRARAEAYEARGEALYSSSDLSQAAEQFKLALDLFEQNDPWRPLALLMLAEVSFEADKKEEGVRRAIEALQLWSSQGDEYGVAQARATLGTFSMTTGQFETARCHCEEAQKIFKKVGDEDLKAKALNTLGSTSMGMGDAEAALAYWLQARTAYARVQDRLGEASAITAIGKAFIAMRRYQDLPQLFHDELRLAKEAASKSMEASALADIAGVEELNRQYRQAESHYLQSVETYNSLGLTSDEGDILALLAEFYIKQGKYELAISSLQRAFTIRERNNEVEDEARIHYDLAYIYRKLGRLEDASAAIQPAIPIIERQRSMIRKFDSRASYFAAVHNYYALHINLLMLRHRSRMQDELAVGAFEASERSKVRSLIDWLVKSDQGMSCDALWRRQADEALMAPPTADALPSSEGHTLSPVTLTQAQALIRGDNAILLEYALGDENSYLWAVTENEIVSYELPSAKKLKYLVQRLRKAVTAAQQCGYTESIDECIQKTTKSEQDYKRYSLQLSRLLLGPIQLEGKKRIIFVPEGALQYVPFSALPLRDTHGKSSILIDKHEVVILPSVSALAAIRKAAENRPRPTLPAAVFANPVFERDEASALRINASKRTREITGAVDCEKDVQRSWGSGRIPPLPKSHLEAQAVAQSLGGPGKNVFVAERYQASRKTVLARDLGAYRILIFATHTLLDAEHPTILLSTVNASGTPQNGCIGLSDINNFKLSADVVVLSSCKSALGKEVLSEGIIGLPRSFLRAGARSVLATLWEVDDAATADLMARFYHHLHLDENPASALRNAQLDIRGDKRWSKEYFWAAFVLQGDYTISSLN